jgi:hypothetical protein
MINLSKLCVSLFLLFLKTTLLSVSIYAQSNDVSGIVIDKLNKLPISGVKIDLINQLKGEKISSGFTDAKGLFRYNRQN